MLKLLIEDDEGKQTVVPLIRDEITIGRKEGNTIRLTERNVSRRHARVLKVNGGIYVEDVASRYGTFLNGAKLESREKFATGDELEIGDYKLSIQDESKQAESTQIREAVQEDEGPMPIPMREQGRLVVISSNFAGQEFPLVRTEMVIGRNAECDIIIDHRSISGTHAKVVRGANKVFKIVDLKSANGVKVNGAPFSVKELHSGEIVDLGHVRFRFCAPGELWSFQLAADLVQEPPAQDKSSLILLVALLVVIVVAVVAFFALQGGDDEESEEKAQVTSTTNPSVAGPAEPRPGESAGESADIDALVLECDNYATKGDFDLAIAKCKAALDLRPNSPLIQEKYDRALVEKGYKDKYLDIIDLIEQKDCEFALIDLDSIDDENSWAARQILKEDVRGQARECIEGQTSEVVKIAIDDKDWETASDSIDSLEQLLPESTLVASLREDLDTAKKRKDRDDEPSSSSSGSSRKKPREPKEEPKDSGGSDDGGSSGGADCMDQAEEDVKKGQSLMAANPSKAASLFKGALKCKSNAKWRAKYAFALERQGKICDAYKQYTKAVKGLSGKLKDRTQKSIDKYSGQCN